MRHNSKPKVSVMTRPFQIEISESQQELEKALNMPRLQAKKDCKCSIGLKVVKWIADKRWQNSGTKSSNYSLVKEIQRWGCSGLLEVKHAPGQAPLVTGEA